MKLGTNDIGSVYLGTNAVQKVYLGTNEVWSATDPDYQAILDYATTQGYTLPSAAQQVLQNQLLVDLKDAGVWSKLDTFAVFATDGNSDFALIDWKRLSQYTAVNSPTFTTNEGFTGDGSTSYLATNFNAFTSGVNYTASDASFGVYDDISLGSTGYLIYVRSNSGINENYLYSSGSLGTINSNNTLNRKGFSVNYELKIVSLGSGNQYLIGDGVTDNTFTFVGSPSVINTNWTILRGVNPNTLYSNARVRAFFMGSDTESVAADFHTALSTYYNSL